MGSITINGKTYKGNNVSVINNAVWIDGKKVEEKDQTIVGIKLEGDVQNVHSDVGVNCGDVKGNVTCNGSVTCDRVEGNVVADGSVICDKVYGSIKAKGSVISS